MRRTLLISIGMAGLIITQSCSLFKEKVEFDMQPFSDNTTVLFQEAAKVDRPYQFKSLATFVDIEKYAELKQKAEPVIYGLRGISYYSNQVVAISNSKMSEKGKNRQLASFVKDILEVIEHKERVDSLGLTYAQVDSTIRAIRQADTFREGIKAADPATKTVVLSMFDRLDSLEVMVKDVVAAFEERVYTDYELAITNYLTLKELQNDTQFRLTQVYLAQSGSRSTLDSLRAADESLGRFFKGNKPYEEKAYEDAEVFLLARLENVDDMLKQLDDDKAEFMDMKREIGEWQIQADEKIKITRTSLIAWSQSHKNLGQGLVTPPIIGIETIANLLEPSK